MEIGPLKPPQSFKFPLFFSTFAILNSITNHIPSESPNISTSFAPSSLSPTSPAIMKGKSLLVFESTPTSESIDHMSNLKHNERKRKRPKRSEWEINKVFQNWWATRFPWFEPICGPNRKMKMIKCKICFNIEGKEKLIVPKLNSLIKHFGLKKCSKAKPWIILGQSFLCPFNVHVKNDKLHASRGSDIVVV